MDVEDPGDLAAIDRDEVRDLMGDDAVRDPMRSTTSPGVSRRPAT